MQELLTYETQAFDEQAVEKAREYIQSRAPNGAVQEVADMFAAFGDATRIKLLCSLAQGEMCVGDLALILDVTASAVSHQLRSLRALRLVKFRRQGKLVLYSLDDDHVLTLLDVGLTHVHESHSR